MTELQQLMAMLDRAGIGHGLRHDFNPPGTAVQIESEDSCAHRDWTSTEFWFDDNGVLQTVTSAEGQEG